MIGRAMKLLDDKGLAEKGLNHSKVQRWRHIRAGNFPKPIKVGCRNLWVEREIDEWIANRIAARDSAPASNDPAYA